MNKGVKQISYLVILLVTFLFISKINSTKSVDESFLYDFDIVTINLKKNDSLEAVNAFNDFSNQFSNIYIDSTDIYNIQNVLKITDFENLEFQYDLLKCKDFNQLFDFIDQYITNLDNHSNLNHLYTINQFVKIFKKHLLSNQVSDDIGHEILLSLITDYTSNHSLHNRKIVLKVNPEANYLDTYSLISEFNNRISNIDYIVLNNKKMFNDFTSYNNFNNRPITLKLDEYYIAISRNLHELSKLSNFLDDEDFIKTEGIFQYINHNTTVRGERFKKIRNFPVNSKGNITKQYLQKNDFLNYLNNYNYELNQKKYELNLNFNFNSLINELIFNLSLIQDKIDHNDNYDILYMFIQDIFFAKRLEYVEYFGNVEPLTVDFLNSSIKKEFYNDKNNVFITKIHLKNQSKKYKKYIHSLFNENTTIFK